MTIYLFEVTSQQKAAEVSWLLANGETLTTTQVAERYQMTWSGAYKLMTTISQQIPITQDDKSRWRRFDID